MNTSTTYCTVLARNYLPKGLALADSLRQHHPDATLVVLVTDARSEQELPRSPAGVRFVTTGALGLPEREVLRLAASYDLVEFATAIKPQLFMRLLEETEQVAYLDPDTYVTSPMVELGPALAESQAGILLTPHFLDPVPPAALFTEGHLLNVGVYNLGFCAVDRRSVPFLEWWWAHLKDECLHDPLAGLFVDQKWVDIGSVLFHATAWQHRGYNVGVANLHERELAVDANGYYIVENGDRLRLFHFHAFDSSSPEQLSTRHDTSALGFLENKAVGQLSTEYAEVLSAHERSQAAAVYTYATDTRGRRIARQTRRVFREQSAAGARLPSPFLEAEADAYDAWRRRAARRQVAKHLAGDLAKSIRLALPDEYDRVKQRFPVLTSRLRSRFVGGGGIWG